MQRCYEFNDTLLESIEQDTGRVSINLRAMRSEIERTAAELPPILYRQQIRLVLDGAEMNIDSPNLPSWLMEGSFSAESLDAECHDCTREDTIPVSLRSARGVELVMAGLHEGSGDFITIRVKADTLKLEALGEPQSLQHTRAVV